MLSRWIFWLVVITLIIDIMNVIDVLPSSSPIWVTGLLIGLKLVLLSNHFYITRRTIRVKESEIKFD